jgi:hypothetical protein
MAEAMILVRRTRKPWGHVTLQYDIPGAKGREIDAIRAYLQGNPLVTMFYIEHDSSVTFTARGDRAAVEIERVIKRVTRLANVLVMT